MARITNLTEGVLDRMSLHDPVEATVFAYELDGRRLLQINTVGRATREMPGKVSQSIQLDQQSAAQLFAMLRNHFGFT